MDLKFKVINQKLIKKNDKYIVNKSDNYLRLFFDFETVDWNKVNKYVILRNEENKSFQYHYTNEGVKVPYDAIKNKFVYISLYGANKDYRITTNELKIKLYTSGYTTDISSINESSKDIIVEIHEKLDEKVDKNEISKVGLTGKYNDLINIPSEFNPSPHNHDEYVSINDIENLPIVTSVSYNDLTDKPETFTPSKHTHESEDIIDLEDNTGIEIKKSYRTLINKIRTYGE